MCLIKRLYHILFVFVLTLSCVSCSSLQGPVFKKITDIPQNKSVVYLYYPNNNINPDLIIKYKNKEVCILKNGGYYPFIADEGKFEISSEIRSLIIDNSTEFVFKADAGKSYFIECQVEAGYVAKPIIKLVPENFGMNRIKDCILLDTKR
jgi:hypothetical protein